MRGVLLLLALCVALCSCAEKPAPRPPMPDSPEAWTILPGNFIIDLAAGAKVRLNPAVQEFVLYPSAEAAKKAFPAAFPAENPDDWRVYLLEGNFADLAIPCGAGFCLGVPVRAIDWSE